MSFQPQEVKRLKVENPEASNRSNKSQTNEKNKDPETISQDFSENKYKINNNNNNQPIKISFKTQISKSHEQKPPNLDQQKISNQNEQKTPNTFINQQPNHHWMQNSQQRTTQPIAYPMMPTSIPQPLSKPPFQSNSIPSQITDIKTNDDNNNNLEDTSLKNQTNENLTNETEGNEQIDDIVYCCGRKELDIYFMIGCDKCEDWFHGTCVGITAEQAEKIDKWYCKKCQSKQSIDQPNLKLKLPIKKKEKKLPTPRQLKKKKISSQIETFEDYAAVRVNNPDTELELSNKVTTTAFDFYRALKNCPSVVDENAVLSIKGSEINIDYLSRCGFQVPLMISPNDSDLGVQVPDLNNFGIRNVEELVGSDRSIPVFDVANQQEEDPQWTLKKWCDYYLDKDQHDKLYNVISLEFSDSNLINLVKSPKIVREIDWSDQVWPSSSNSYSQNQEELELEKQDIPLKPKVQYYCLMSVAGAYTDWHLDFGGSSVWYHLLKGTKIFLFAPPSEENLKAYKQWTSSEKQSQTFFGNLVPKCYYTLLKPGYTMFIPTGWIHAVYTPEDSLVFGGNFLHSFNIGLQLEVFQIEEDTQVPQKFRFPVYEKIYWFAGKYFEKKLSNDKKITAAEYAGLLFLISKLDAWIQEESHHKFIPKSILEPAKFVENLSQLMLEAEEPSNLPEESQDFWSSIISKNFPNLKVDFFLSYVEQSTKKVLENIQRVITQNSTAPNPFLKKKPIVKKTPTKKKVSKNLNQNLDFEDDSIQEEEDDLFDPKDEVYYSQEDYHFKKKPENKIQKDKKEKIKKKKEPKPVNPKPISNRALGGSSKDRIASKFSKRGKKLI